MKKIPIGVDDFKKLIENNALYIDKTKITGYLPCSEIYTDFSISNPLNNFLFLFAFFISKKYFKVDIFKVLPNLLGRVKSLTSAASSKSSIINFVLSI